MRDEIVTSLGAADRDCRWSSVRCYVPGVAVMLVNALLIAWGTLWLRGGSLEAIRPRNVVNGLLLWFVMTPVVFGLLRGVRRSRRHMTRRTI